MDTSSQATLLVQLEKAVDALLLRSAQAGLSQDTSTSTPSSHSAHQLHSLIERFAETVELLMPLTDGASGGDWIALPPRDDQVVAQMQQTLFNRLDALSAQILPAEAAAPASLEAVLAGRKAVPAVDALAGHLAQQEQRLEDKLRALQRLQDKLAQLLAEKDRALQELTAIADKVSYPASLHEGREWHQGSEYDSVAVIDATLFLRDVCDRRKALDLADAPALDAFLCRAMGHCLCVSKPEDNFCPIVAAITTAKPFQTESRRPLPDGGECLLEVALFPIERTQGEIEKVVRVVRDITARERNHREVHQLAYYDELTKLANRTLFNDRLKHGIAQAQRRQQRLAVLYIDLDDFKKANDTFGHNNGDLLLQEAARRLRGCLRESDSVARFGGDEFAVFLPEIDGEQEVLAVAKKILRDLSRPYSLRNALVTMTSSIGVALCPDDGLTPQTLLHHADMAMYTAKKAGKNNYHFFSEELHRAIQERAELEADMSLAVKNGDFFLDYQPQYDMASGTILGVEALLRWRLADGQVRPPATFVSLAEETGHILPIGDWVLRTACRQLMFWHRRGYRQLRMGVNLSRRQVLSPDFQPKLERILVETGVDPKTLSLEISERMFSGDSRDLHDAVCNFKGMGVQLAVDDFGTGAFALSHLSHLPIDRLKIDRSLLANVDSQPRSAALVDSILAMARRLDLTTLAEGIETDQQVAILSHKGCQEMQGFYFARPMKPLELSLLLEKQQHRRFP